MRRIICAGNRFVPGDDAGPRVHDLLSRSALPPGVEVVDGGLGGLDLVGFVEGAEKVVFVDQLAGLGRTGVVRLGPGDLPAGEPPPFGHADGLGYLLRALPIILEKRTPDWTLVGVEGDADEKTIHDLAGAALKAVTE